MLTTKFIKICYGTLALTIGLLAFGPNGYVKAATANPHQFVADVTGDNFADAITFDAHSGDWWVAPSNGSNAFTTPSRWISGFGVGSAKQFMADVNGDGKDDAITFHAASGNWDVAISCGTLFGCGGVSNWIHGHGVGSSNQLLGDINGDGKADAVLFFNSIPGICQNFVCSGSWWAATSNLAGNRFDTPGQWFSGGHGVGSTKQFIGDVDGDAKADAVVWNSITSDWYVANSNAVHFNGPNLWADAVGIGATYQTLADVTGDGKADAVLNFPYQSSKYGGSWWVGVSNGANFDIATEWIRNFGYGVTDMMFANVFATSNEDLITFDSLHGDWWVMASDNTAFTSASRWISGFGVGT